ncbi:MAG: hypothetical protein A4E56_02579 [Pelotomaculum sp. PtaU1.Bin065]|nr:MAG: hypothetical protein A4E56_02579 [Pelotomaculum sp. PtaU1.Bin065]
MQCLEVEELLSPYLDEVLALPESEDVTSHLAVCASCREKYDVLKETVNFIKDLPEVEPPPGFSALVMSKIAIPTREKAGYGGVFMSFRKSGWLRACSFAAMFVVILGITTLMYGMPNQWYQRISSLLVHEQQNEPAPDSETKNDGSADTSETGPKEDSPAHKNEPSNAPGSPAGLPVVPQKMAEKEEAIITQVAYGNIPASNKKLNNLVLDATLALSTEDPSDVPEKIANLADDNGGYLVPGGSQEEGTLTVKVPADRFNYVLSGIREMGDADTRRVAGEDVSGKISSYESNIRDLANEERILQQAMGKAAPLAESEVAQARLNKVQTDMEQQKKLYSKLLTDTQTATIKVNLR